MTLYNIQHIRSFIGLLVGICLTCSLATRAQEQSSSLVPTDFSLDHLDNKTNVLFALQHQLFFSFGEPVELQPAATVFIVCEEDTVAEGVLRAYNIEYSKGIAGYVEADFDSLFLPKDNDYTLVIGAGCIYSQGAPSCTNAEIKRAFHIPDHIKMLDSTPAEGDTLNELSSIVITLSARQDYTSNFKPTIYKGNVPTDYGSVITSSYNSNAINIKFGGYFQSEPIVLEDGADYTIVIPEGVMKRSWTHYRDDISNEEMRIHIKGGSSTNINTTNTTEKPAIHCDGKTLHIDNTQGQRIRIFALDGRMIHNIICQENSTTLTLPAAGLYIVNTGEHTDKISVK